LADAFNAPVEQCPPDSTVLAALGLDCDRVDQVSAAVTSKHSNVAPSVVCDGPDNQGGNTRTVVVVSSAIALVLAIFAAYFLL